MFISTITPSLIATQGTAIGGALEKACTAFSEKTENGKSVIIITDGENHEDDAEAAAKEAAEKGIQVNVVGIGSVNGAPVPIEGSNDYIRDQAGNYISSALNEEMCMKIAKARNATKKVSPRVFIDEEEILSFLLIYEPRVTITPNPRDNE